MPWAVTGIGVKQCMHVDPQRAPGVRTKYGFEERTISLLSSATGKWSRTQWHPALCIWEDEMKARAAYAAAREHAAQDGTISIQMAAVKLRDAWRDAGGFDAKESA